MSKKTKKHPALQTMILKSEEKPDMEFFSVYDSKTNTYKEPFPAPNSAVVIRDFTNAFSKPTAPENNQFYMNSEDYKLFRVASFYMKTGQLLGFQPEHVINLHELRAAVDAKSGPRAL